MAETKIEWATYTFNPWEGCEKVSPGCKHCYAEARDQWLHGGAHWGPGSLRMLHVEQYWNQPLKWQREASLCNRVDSVFCGSLCDILEAHPTLDPLRRRVFDLVPQTPNLRWLFLTKRPENFRLFPEEWMEYAWPKNVLAGFTAENDEYLRKRAQKALEMALYYPSARFFISAEPLLGPLTTLPEILRFRAIGADEPLFCWVIDGGESGDFARPPHPDWFRANRDACQAAGVPYLFKQWGEHRWVGRGHGGSDDVEPRPVRIGKKRAGRLLDGREWNEFPEVRR